MSKEKVVSFSERMGLESFKKELQLSDMDIDLRNSMWNVIHQCVLEYGSMKSYDDHLSAFRFDLMANFLKKPVHQLQEDPFNYVQPFYKVFSELTWNRVYDLMQFLINKPYVMRDYVTHLNLLLEREFSGYRVIGGIIAPISNDLEITSVNDALKIAKKFTALNGVNAHLSNALALMSDRNSPDYSNSIKESVSAVETAAKFITGESTLGNALNRIEHTGISINNQLKESFNKIYNYTNDKNVGIRHAVVGQKVAPDFETAKYILITSSAFVNYLISLAEKSGLLKGVQKKVT